MGRSLRTGGRRVWSGRHPHDGRLHRPYVPLLVRWNPGIGRPDSGAVVLAHVQVALAAGLEDHGKAVPRHAGRQVASAMLSRSRRSQGYTPTGRNNSDPFIGEMIRRLDEE